MSSKKRIYSEVDELFFMKYKGFLEMNGITMIDHIRSKVTEEVAEWEREHPKEVEFYKQLIDISQKLKALKG